MNTSHAALMETLNMLVPVRTAPLPGDPDPCPSCGHIPADCPDECCTAAISYQEAARQLSDGLDDGQLYARYGSGWRAYRRPAA